MLAATTLTLVRAQNAWLVQNIAASVLALLVLVQCDTSRVSPLV